PARFDRAPAAPSPPPGPSRSGWCAPAGGHCAPSALAPPRLAHPDGAPETPLPPPPPRGPVDYGRRRAARRSARHELRLKPLASSTPKRYRYSRRIHSLQKVDDLGRPSRIRRLLISPHQQLSSIALITNQLFNFRLFDCGLSWSKT